MIGRGGVIAAGWKCQALDAIGADKSHSTLYMGGFAPGNESGAEPMRFVIFVR